jgi:hypothetical protein
MMSEKAVSDSVVMPKPTSWWEWLKAKARAVKQAVIELFVPKPLGGRMFYVAARIVAATVGRLAAVVVWSTLIVGASYGLATVLLAFATMIALLVIAIIRITVEPDNKAEVIAV